MSNQQAAALEETNMDGGSTRPSKDKPSAFFGRRKGKPLSPRQQALMDEVLPKVLLDPTQQLEDPQALFSAPKQAIWLEIGFGGAEHMSYQAMENPQVGLIGCEPFVNGVSKAVDQIAAHDIGNIRLYNEDAAHILDWLPEGSIDKLFLLYPDPWHKKRHWKRRFVSHHNLKRIIRVLKPGGRFRFASDNCKLMWSGHWSISKRMRSTKSWSQARSRERCPIRIGSAPDMRPRPIEKVGFRNIWNLNA